jgi:hypothetical protein
MQKWEYKLITAGVDEEDNGVLISKLDKLGKEGWELVSYFRTSGSLPRCYLKRPI